MIKTNILQFRTAKDVIHMLLCGTGKSKGVPVLNKVPCHEDVSCV
jgi:hypothetical protein